MGYFATFMARPAIKGYYASGWHLHQSLVATSDGKNLFMPESADQSLSPLGRAFLGGLLHFAVPGTPFATPTVNGYRRFRANSLAPDRATWASDNRGAMLRVLGAPDDAATRIENRVGEPAANPYLFIMSQIVAGLDGIAQKRDPGPSDDEPYSAKRPMLPKGLAEALDALDKEPLFRRELGDVFIDYFVKLKRNELGRYQQFLQQAGLPADGDEPTEWEQNEYFDFF
jgi:glutamine synthetase